MTASRSGGNPSNAVLLEKIENVAGDVAQTCVAVKELAGQLAKLQALGLVEGQRTTDRAESQQEHQADTGERLDKLTADVEALQKAMGPLIVANKIIIWFAIGLAASVMTLLFAIFTHQVTITF